MDNPQPTEETTTPPSENPLDIILQGIFYTSIILTIFIGTLLITFEVVEWITH